MTFWFFNSDGIVIPSSDSFRVSEDRGLSYGGHDVVPPEGAFQSYLHASSPTVPRHDDGTVIVPDLAECDKRQEVSIAMNGRMPGPQQSAGEKNHSKNAPYIYN